ncbi:hypothetical protein SUDANB1_05261 [Streptomyces sp. enrichment culture]|uniref:hypothetical protein n=1 Tax=Streptomyces sp. enrichment culture TaxID=1795815 RepID=UPI003F56986C
MARLQILELPEGADDSRPPYVLVVDETVPQRVIIGMDHGPVRDYWHDVAERIGARGVIVTAETVEIPANDVSEFRTDVAADEPFVPDPGEAVRRMATLDDDSEWRARQLEGKLKEYAEASYRESLDRMDAITDALGLDRLRDWDEIVRAAADVRAVAEAGHRFGGIGYNDPVRCRYCGLDAMGWRTGRDRRGCAEVQAAKGGE